MQTKFLSDKQIKFRIIMFHDCSLMWNTLCILCIFFLILSYFIWCKTILHKLVILLHNTLLFVYFSTIFRQIAFIFLWFKDNFMFSDVKFAIYLTKIKSECKQWSSRQFIFLCDTLKHILCFNNYLSIAS
jgi:hypothetical protein